MAEPFTDYRDYNKKQLKAVEIIKQLAVGCYHNHTLYGDAKEALKTKRLGKAFKDEELYWVCTELWTEWLTSPKVYEYHEEINKQKMN